MFSIRQQPFGSFTLITIRHETTRQFVTINPGIGGMLHQLGLRRKPIQKSMLMCNSTLRPTDAAWQLNR